MATKYAMPYAPAALVFLGTCAYSASGHGSSRPGSETSGLAAMTREIFGGSELRAFAHLFLSDPLPDEIVGTSASQVTKLEDGQFEQTFISHPMTLKNGEVGNMWWPIDWPQGHIAVSGFVADIVKAGPDGKAPPPEPCCGGPHQATREEVFMHHWTVNKWQLPKMLFNDMVKRGGYNYHIKGDAVGWTEALADAGLNAGANGPCFDANLHLYFGIGNEVRSKTLEDKFPYEFPAPYGVEFNSEWMRRVGEFMVLNIHLIDLQGVNDKRACSECKCSEMGVQPCTDCPWANTTFGGLACCHSTWLDGAKCKLQQHYEPSSTTYYMRYTVRWRPFNVFTTKPLEVITLDATDNNSKWGDLPFVSGGFNESHKALYSDPASKAIINNRTSGDYIGMDACHVEYYVPACEAGHSCVQTLHNSWELPWPVDIVFVRNHMHAGGINMTTYASGYNCTGKCTYDHTCKHGASGGCTFSKGNLIDITTCTNVPDGRGRGHLSRGDRIFVEAHYQQDNLPHYGVMAMSFVYAHISTNKDVLV